MPRHILLTTTTAITFMAAPALADLTAAEVWADWQAIAEASGQSLTATSERQSGNTLTVSGVTFGMEFPDGSVSGDLGDFTFTEQGDGSVAIDLTDEYPLTVSGDDPVGGPFSTTVMVRHTGLDIVASGDAANTLYAYDAPQISISSKGVESDGEMFSFDLDVSMTAMKGEYEIADGTPMQVRSDLTAGGLVMAFAASDPENPGDEGSFTATLSDIKSTSFGTMTSFSAMAGLAEMVKQGMNSTSTISYGNGRYTISGTSEGTSFDAQAGVESGRFDVALGEEGLSYGGTNQDVTMRVSSSEFPIPDASLAMEQTSWQLAMPVTVSDDPQDFALSLKLNGLTISDMLWSMFDPGAALPRDPATLIIDLAGKGNWLIDITDPEIADQPLDEIPGEVHAMTINELRLDLAGAQLTGTGDFTVNNDVMPPVPAGTIDLQLVGGNALIDALVGMGLVPEDQAMGARMMLGLFARPGGGEDTLVSKIEFTPEGGIIANGQQLR